MKVDEELKILDDLPNSAVEMQVKDKVNGFRDAKSLAID